MLQAATFSLALLAAVGAAAQAPQEGYLNPDLPVGQRVDDLDTDELPPDFALKQGIEILAKLNNPDQIADLVSCTLLSSPMERQLLLETIDLETRLKHLIHFLMSEIRRQQKKKNK